MTKIECITRHIVDEYGEEKIHVNWKSITVSCEEDEGGIALLTIDEKTKVGFDEFEIRLDAEDARVLALLLTNAAKKMEKGGEQ